MKRIGILTSGGNASASNAAIHAVCKTSYQKGIELMGFYQGYHGVVENKAILLNPLMTAEHTLDNGSFLKSARSHSFKTPEGFQKALSTLKSQEIDALVVIGGNGSLAGASNLAQAGISVIGIPATIDNDIPYTDFSLGVDTACNIVLDAIYRIKEGAESIVMENDFRVFLMEVMGRNCGYLALATSISGDCDFAIVPEIPFDMKKLAQSVVEKSKSGEPYALILLAEAVASADDFGDELERLTCIRPRLVVLGHTQRGGRPSHFDLILATRFGNYAVNFLMEGEKNKYVALQNNKIVAIDLEQISFGKKELDPELVKLHDMLA